MLLIDRYYKFLCSNLFIMQTVNRGLINLPLSCVRQMLGQTQNTIFEFQDYHQILSKLNFNYVLISNFNQKFCNFQLNE